MKPKPYIHILSGAHHQFQTNVAFAITHGYAPMFPASVAQCFVAGGSGLSASVSYTYSQWMAHTNPAVEREDLPAELAIETGDDGSGYGS